MVENGGGTPYNSFGNGSAMRCSAVGFCARSVDECIHLATASAHFTHNHPEGIKGAAATALCIYYLMEGKDKEFVREKVLRAYYPHHADTKLDDIRPTYQFNETCQETVPQSILCFLESESFEDCLKLCCSMGGDADTMGAIAGPMAYAYHRHIPDYLIELADDRLPKEMTAACRRFDRFADEIKGAHAFRGRKSSPSTLMRCSFSEAICGECTTAARHATPWTASEQSREQAWE